jgi:TonB family protein
VLRLTTFAARSLAVGLSGAVHAAIFLTPLGHPPAARAGTPELALVDIEVEPAPAPERPELEPLDNRATRDVLAPTHTHPYPVPPSHDWTPHDPSLVHVMAAVTEKVTPQADTSSVLTSDTTDTTPRFTLIVSAGAPGAGGRAVSGSARSDVAQAGDPEGALPERAVDKPARLVRGETPAYPSEARAEGVEADVKLELVVSPSGTVDDVRVVRRAGHGLDEAAAVAARQFRFAPAVKDGRAVRVRMSWAVEFRLD